VTNPPPETNQQPLIHEGPLQESHCSPARIDHNNKDPKAQFPVYCTILKLALFMIVLRKWTLSSANCVKLAKQEIIVCTCIMI
jgi:hypothetical protein